METINQWKNLTFDTISDIIKDIAAALPGLFGALVVLLFGWMIIRITRYVLKKIFKIAKIDGLSEKINEAKLFGESKFKIDISAILLSFVKWLLWLVFIIVAADIMQLTVISEEIANLLRYLPILLSAMVIFMIGLYAARLVKKALITVFDSMGIGGSKIISSIVFYIIAIFVTITALNQAQIDTTIITSNITMILGAFLLAAALGFGLGSREVIRDVLRTFYTRKNYAVGDIISIGETKGTIDSIDNISMTLNTEKGKVVIPIKEVVENRVQIHD